MAQVQVCRKLLKIVLILCYTRASINLPIKSTDYDEQLRTALTPCYRDSHAAGNKSP